MRPTLSRRINGRSRGAKPARAWGFNEADAFASDQRSVADLDRSGENRFNEADAFASDQLPHDRPERPRARGFNEADAFASDQHTYLAAHALTDDALQ